MESVLRKIRMEDYDYDLSDDRIAKHPLSERDQSKLLIFNSGRLFEDKFYNLPGLLPPGSFLVFNDTKVLHARLFFRKASGARIEVFCLEPHNPADYQATFQVKGTSVWKCMVGNAKRWKSGTLVKNLLIGNEKVFLKAEKIGRDDDVFLIRFIWDNRFSFGEIIESCGILPIPPYLNRETEDEDEVRYQTVYASVMGSVAAPTAGLHFTDSVFSDLKLKNIKTGMLTLHVGAGTFRPVKSPTIAGHPMHEEWVSVSKVLIQNLLDENGRVVAVGTTSLRTLESLYWLGLKLDEHIDFIAGSDSLEVSQWEPYEPHIERSTPDILRNIIHYMDANGRQTIQFPTKIIIVPGYKFRIVNGLITNFHQPQSTLLLLIAAFLGADWKNVYQYALANGFRFLSYGDSNLYLP